MRCLLRPARDEGSGVRLPRVKRYRMRPGFRLVLENWNRLHRRSTMTRINLLEEKCTASFDERGQLVFANGMWKCPDCNSWELCEADCPSAPWNQ